MRYEFCGVAAEQTSLIVRNGLRPLLLVLVLCLALHPFAFFLSPFLSAAEPAAILVGSPPRPAELLSIAEGGDVQLRVEGETRSATLAGVIAWGAFRSTALAPQVVLADGGVLVADVLGLKDDLLRIDAPVAGPAGIPIERVAGILFHPPGDVLRRDRLTDRLQSRDGDTDQLILENGDELTGTVVVLAEASLELRTAGGTTTVTISLERVAALRFNPRLVERPAPRKTRVLVGLSDGSRLAATSIELDEAEAALDAGNDLVWRVPRSEVVAVQPLGGGVTYLSDLKPTGYAHVPFLNLSWPHVADRNVLGGQLRASGAVFPKGIGMHSASRLTYRLDRATTRFAAEIALDDSAGTSGSVVFRVFVDKQERFASPAVRGGDAPMPVSVDVQGGKTVSLVVDFADRGDELDHANWLNARLEE